MEKLQSFYKEENGAVSVDWVVLVAGVVGLSVALLIAIESGAVQLTDATSDFLSTWTF